MNAKTAKQIATRNRDKHIEQANKAAQKEYQRLEAAAKAAYPKELEQCYIRIKAAVKDGRECTSFDAPHSYNVAKLVRDLQKDGYTVTSRYYSGYQDYGDSAAPCNIWEEGYTLTISW